MILAFSRTALEDSRTAFKYSPWGGKETDSVGSDDGMVRSLERGLAVCTNVPGREDMLYLLTGGIFTHLSFEDDLRGLLSS